MPTEVGSQSSPSRSARLGQTIATRVPPQAFFLSSAVFHYLGPSFAVLLFARVAVLGVLWLRIASAAAIFAAWRRPWRIVGGLSWSQRCLLLGLGGVLGAMNACFYLAIDRLPLSTVGAIEFLGPVALAALGVRSMRNLGALGLAAGGALVLTQVQLEGHPLGLALAFANCALFTAYVVLGHRVAAAGGVAGIDRLGVSMLVALVLTTPFGIWGALPAVGTPWLLGAGAGVGVCSSVVPYVCDQLAMARLPRPTFALMLSLLPASATAIGLIVLHQVPRPIDLAGIALVIAGIALHQETSVPSGSAAEEQP